MSPPYERAELPERHHNCNCEDQDYYKEKSIIHSCPRACGAKRTRNSTCVPPRQARSWIARLIMASLAKARSRDTCSGLPHFCIRPPRTTKASEGSVDQIGTSDSPQRVLVLRAAFF